MPANENDYFIGTNFRGEKFSGIFADFDPYFVFCLFTFFLQKYLIKFLDCFVLHHLQICLCLGACIRRLYNSKLHTNLRSITLLGQIFAGRNFREFSRFRDFFQEIRENFSREKNFFRLFAKINPREKLEIGQFAKLHLYADKK